MNLDELNELTGESGKLDDLNTDLERIKELAKSVGDTITDAFTQALVNGKSLKSLLTDIAKAFAQIAVKAALQPVGNMITGFVTDLFKGTNSANPKVEPFAKGGVLNAPTFFPMQGNIGLAGEAGPEAILPLKRNSRGQLGVASDAGQAPIMISMTVNTNNAHSFAQAEAEISAGLLGAIKRGQRAS
ncbi:phage tail tape measure protein [Maritalea mediterranea]|uniref:Phage tail tape measure protein n=1 Tax=Maritalea mediterranea TaxID=2909667 RepID=A0ABS9E4Z7_9HYPH|nr:phage tail tape measure protein [Maritalea mediterranea]MCF4097940.1 phage tail tape measure protein [Maritalea mediterranea]